MRETVGSDSRWGALLVLCAGMLMIVIDSTVVNVALPAIQSDLGFSQSSLAWVVNAYLIAFGGLLLLAGRLGDLTSRKGVFVAGLGVFSTASLLCGVARSQEMLIAARFVQGIGGAMTSAVILGMIVTMFPDPRAQARAIGVYAFTASAGGSIGLLAGGVLTQLLDWHWIFFINLPIGVVATVLALRPVREALAARPLMPLRVLRARAVWGSNVIQALAVAGMFGMFFLGALYLQRVLGYDALRTGLAFLPTAVVMAVLSLCCTERLITRHGPRRMLLPGLVLAAAGLALFARVPVGGHYLTDILPAMVLIGTGVGVAFPALSSLAMSGATPSDAGLASGLLNTTMQVGAAFGLAVLATLSAARTGALVRHGEPAAGALTDGYRLGFLVAAVLVAASIAIAVTVLRPERRDEQAPVSGEADLVEVI